MALDNYSGEQTKVATEQQPPPERGFGNRQREQKSARVFRAIRKALLSGRLRLGDRIQVSKVQELLKETGDPVSRMPIRKVLAQLEAEGIVEVVPQSGTTVRVPKDQEIKEIWDSRVALEEFMIVQLACKRGPDLSAVRLVHKKMKDWISQCPERPTNDHRFEFVELDREFHKAMAAAAGYPRLGEDVDLLRLKLMIVASDPPETKRPMMDVVEEHQRLLLAIQPRAGVEWFRPDINEVKLAFRLHVRNAAKIWWRIDDKVRPDLSETSYSRNEVFDIPDGAVVFNDPESALLYFFQRMCLELCAIKELARRRSGFAPTLVRLDGEMKEVRDRIERQEGDPKELDARFQNLDISFHTALCYASGLHFGEEVILFAWHQLRRWRGDKDKPAPVSDLDDTITEHREILSAINMSRGEAEDVELAVAAMEKHLVNALFRRQSCQDRKRLQDQVHQLTAQIRSAFSKTGLAKKN